MGECLCGRRVFQTVFSQRYLMFTIIYLNLYRDIQISPTLPLPFVLILCWRILQFIYTVSWSVLQESCNPSYGLYCGLGKQEFSVLCSKLLFTQNQNYISFMLSHKKEHRFPEKLSCICYCI